MAKWQNMAGKIQRHGSKYKNAHTRNSASLGGHPSLVSLKAPTVLPSFLSLANFRLDASLACHLCLAVRLFLTVWFTSLAAPLMRVRSKMIFTPNPYPSIVAGHILERTSFKSQTPKGRGHILAWGPFITLTLGILQPNIVQGSLHPDGVIVTVVHHDLPSWIFAHDLSHLPWHTLYHPYCRIILTLSQCPLNIHCSICKLFATSLRDNIHFLEDMFAFFSMEVSYLGKS